MKSFAVPMALLTLSAISPAQSLRTQMETMGRHACRAMAKKNLNGFVKAVKPYVTDDFKYTDQGHTMGFDEMAGLMKQTLGQMKKMTLASSKILTLKQMGDRGRTTTLHRMGGLAIGPDKKSHRIFFSGISTEILVKEGRHWKMQSMDWKNDKMTMDGKPINPMSPSGR